MSISSLLDQQLTLERQETSFDASGGAVRTFTALLADIPFSIAAASAAVVANYGRLDMVVNHHLYTTTDLDAFPFGGARLGDRLTDGVVFYLVKSVLKSANRQVSSEVIYQIDCERRDFL